MVLTKEAEIRALIHDNWTAVARAGRHLSRHGALTIEHLAGPIALELCLTSRDEPALHKILQDAAKPLSTRSNRSTAEKRSSVGANPEFSPRTISNGDAEVNLALLQSQCPASPRVPKPPPVTGNRKYRIENHGSPIAPLAEGETVNKPPTEARIRQMRQVFCGSGALTARTAPAKTVSAAPPACNKKISREQFMQASMEFGARGVSENETRELLGVLDPKKTGMIDAEEFVNRFGKEWAKPKSLRNSLGHSNNDGTYTAFEWPASFLAPVKRGGGPCRGGSPGRGGNESARRSKSSRLPMENRSAQLRKTATERNSKIVERRFNSGSTNLPAVKPLKLDANKLGNY